MKTELLNKIPSKQKKEIMAIVNELSELKNVEKVVLFWSFARGDFVLSDVTVENETTRWYHSDYDILVIVKYFKKNYNKVIEKKVWEIKEFYNIDRGIDVITEGITHVNKMIRERRYFYLDIIKEGVMLFDRKQHHLAKAKILTPEKKKEIQKEDFWEWFGSWDRLFEFYEMGYERRYLNEAVFLLHQTVEKHITWYLLVKSWYRPKTHDLKELMDFLVNLDNRFENWFDLTKPEDEKHFELLKKAYIEARYSYNYRITQDELKFIEKKALELRRLIEELCKEEIGE